MSSPRRYEISMSSLTSAAIRAQHQLALFDDMGTEYRVSFEAIVERLAVDPFAFGEPITTVPVIGLPVRHAMIRPVAVDYGVY